VDGAEVRRKGLRAYGYFGLLVILAAEGLLFFRLEPIRSFFTPIVWSGYLLLIDSMIDRIQGRSLIRNRPGEFLLLLFFSLIFWLIFEFFNLFIRNWHYTGLPENQWIRGFGFIWSFTTVVPAVLLTARLVELCGLSHFPVQKILLGRGAGAVLMVSGAVFLVVPPLMPAVIARYLIAPIWLGFVLLFEPINRQRGGWSLLGDWERGELGRLLSLCISGLVCGILWEFWNFWAGTRWTYDVPIPLGPKVFEMPVGGFLGFLPFALGCHVMFVFVMTLRRRPWFPEREI